VNLWIGDQRAVSTVHRDNYENMYVVVHGCKQFDLLPPCVAPLLGEKAYPTANYVYAEHKWTIQIDKEMDSTPWVELDPANYNEACKMHPPFAHVPKELIRRVHVNKNECLFLPAGWWHRVTQTEPTIAINYWYDREFEAIWSLESCVEEMMAALQSDDKI